MSETPWERQSAETPKSWDAFVAYRDLGPRRSYMKAAHKLGINATTVAQWAKKHAWVARCAAFDAECDRNHLADLREAQKAILKAHMELGAEVRQKAAEALRLCSAEKVGPMAAARLIEVGTKLEQLAVGMPSERVTETVGNPVHDPVNAYFDALTDDELLKMTQDALNAARPDKGPPNASEQPEPEV